jgi:hypothetical protein
MGLCSRCYRELKVVLRAFLDLSKGDPSTGVAVEEWLNLANKKFNEESAS